MKMSPYKWKIFKWEYKPQTNKQMLNTGDHFDPLTYILGVKKKLRGSEFVSVHDAYVSLFL